MSENRIKVSNKVVIMLCVAFLFLVAFFAIPNADENKTTKTSGYDAFYNSFMDMVSTYDVNGKVMASGVGDEEEYSTRLIVEAKEDLDEKNAVASCYYDGTHILQYGDCQAADNAYQFYVNSGLKVQYDEKITADAVSSSSVSYNSWGWDDRYDFMGINSYLTTLEATTDSSEYNNVVVAVLDSGINTAHSLFAGRILLDLGKNFTGEASTTTYAFEDRNGHGTHVSGIIAEVTPNSVYILPLKVLDQNGEGYSSYIIAAIKYAIELRNGTNSEKSLPVGYDLRLMNMSLGVSASSHAEVMASATGLETQINNAYNAGILSVVAAGNERQDTKNVQPANIANAITVTALKRYSTFSKMYILFDSDYSNYGESVDFAAPGSYIDSAWIGGAAAIERESGTSMATPHVTACIALLYMNPNYMNKTPEEMYNVLRDKVKTSDLYPSGTYALGSKTWNKYYGYGCVNIADCAVTTAGKVAFDVPDIFQASAFTLGLSYNESYTGTLQIKYSLNDGSYQIYNSGTKLQISASAKITAIAYVYNGTTIVKASEITTKTYYINNYDLESSYTIDASGSIKYSGTELTTLNVPTIINGRNVTSVSKNAFANAPVEIVNLPNTIKAINEYAFVGNTNLREVNCSANVGGRGVEIGKCAFQKCTNLVDFNIPHAKSLGDSALAYTAVTKVTLSDIVTIGKNAFSASTLKTLVVGRNVTTIDSHADPFNLEKVYGYAGTKAEEFAETYDATFCDLTLSISSDFGTKKVFKTPAYFSLSLGINGYDLSAAQCVVSTEISSAKYDKTIVQMGDNNYLLTLNFSNLDVGTYNLYVVVTDNYGGSVTSATTKIYVENSATSEYKFNADDGNYKVYVDDYLVDVDTFKMYAGNEYSVRIVAEEGYNANNIAIDDHHIEENQPYNVTPTKDVKISISSSAMSVLKVTFSIENGHVEVGGQTLTEVDVERNADCTFVVVGNTGYYVKRVFVNGEVLESDTNTFTIENVTTNKNVTIVLESAYYEIDVTYVNACGVLHSSNLKKVAHGTSRDITIVANEGYKIDFVTVDGIVVKVDKGTFSVDNVTKNTDVVVSFVEKGKSIFDSDNAIIFDYFIVFVSIFGVFVIARVSLFIIRKNKKNQLK